MTEQVYGRLRSHAWTSLSLRLCRAVSFRPCDGQRRLLHSHTIDAYEGRELAGASAARYPSLLCSPCDAKLLSVSAQPRSTIGRSGPHTTRGEFGPLAVWLVERFAHTLPRSWSCIHRGPMIRHYRHLRSSDSRDGQTDDAHLRSLLVIRRARLSYSKRGSQRDRRTINRMRRRRDRSCVRRVQPQKWPLRVVDSRGPPLSWLSSSDGGAGAGAKRDSPRLDLR
ncbi:hypothetical protein BDZ90DRAFT_183866 [Jaminaea rosea]|uniref:Uncharacterized protein n=1 Tax=Jaminaea rosea TaxID=1569628 RepID=A0A316UQF8_9BASI|nr:hypothetical protein BDZ90DRAFT_183866 [Jaminaea rosea]PWN27028.1 hypothetical protein BDZ90DRAFT_183866 [Jaminaea rosea]